MRNPIRILGTAMATAVFSVSLVAAPAYAATATQQSTTSVAQRPDGADRPDHERRFCVKLEHLLRRLVEKGVITAQEAARILNAVGCTDNNTAN